MKNQKIKPLVWIFMGVVFILLAFHKKIFQSDEPGEIHASSFFSNYEISEKQFADTTALRENITFILGKDDEPGNNYFSAATNYYYQHPTDKTERVISTCNSLLDVRNYLVDYPPLNGNPWGIINLVAHGNEWSGLSIPTLPGGKRTTVTSLSYAIETNQFKPLPILLADAHTTFQIHGCAVGRNEELLKAIRIAFAGQRKLKVDASPYFIKYNTGNYFKRKGNFSRQLFEGYYAFYPNSYRPSDEKLIHQLKGRYPKENIDWGKALKKNIPINNTEIYHHTFNIPIVWIVAYPEEKSLPDLEKWKAQKTWLSLQKELINLLKEYKIPQEHFQWTFLKVTHTLDNGKKVPAIRAIGLCTVLTVLRPLDQAQHT